MGSLWAGEPTGPGAQCTYRWDVVVIGAWPRGTWIERALVLP
jgi:hypothetical protein